MLLMAANTAYNDFPRVMFLLARDHWRRCFLHIGDRLTFRHGILVLSVASAVLYIAFRATPARCCPFYAVGVFLAFTLSQTGMVVHWRHHGKLFLAGTDLDDRAILPAPARAERVRDVAASQPLRHGPAQSTSTA